MVSIPLLAVDTFNDLVDLGEDVEEVFASRGFRFGTTAVTTGAIQPFVDEIALDSYSKEE